MKKTVIILVALCVALSTLSAQGLTVGPKASLGSSGFRGDDWDLTLAFLSADNKFALGYSFGGFALFEISPTIGIEVDVMYSALPVKFGDSTYWLQSTYTAFSFPIYGRVSFDAGNLKPYVLAGLDLNLLFGDEKSKDSDGASSSAPVGDSVDNTFLYGIGVGAGVSLPAGSGTLDVGLRYRTNLNELADNVEMFTQSFNIDVAYGFKIR